MSNRSYLVLKVAQGDLTVRVPADNVDLVGVRDVVGQEGLDRVFEVLRAPHTEEPTNWSRRYKANLEKLASGDVIKVAEVVRDLWRRERDRGLSAGEKRMLAKARQILVSELALAENTNEDKAEAILDEVSQANSSKRKARHPRSGASPSRLSGDSGGTSSPTATCQPEYRLTCCARADMPLGEHRVVRDVVPYSYMSARVPADMLSLGLTCWRTLGEATSDADGCGGACCRARGTSRTRCAQGPARDRRGPILVHAVRALARARSVDVVVVAAPPDEVAVVEALLADQDLHAEVSVVGGGATRQELVRLAVASLPPDVDVVLVHDAARPLVPVELVDAVAAAVRHGAAAVIPVLPLTDTVKEVVDDAVVRTPDRSALRAVQTPQGFSRPVLEEAHRIAAGRATTDATDDAGLVEALGLTVQTIPGSPEAFKVTRPIALILAEALLASFRAASRR